METPLHILVVDDEPQLLRLMQAFLERLGYAVTCCVDAASALALMSESPCRFRVVVTDLSLPDLPGPELGLRILDLNPDGRILVCSGYVFEVETLPAAVRRRFGSLQKPFLPKMLVAAVEELLAR